MKILAHCYTYGQNCASGADKMLQSLLEYLAQRECEIRVVIDKCPVEYELNGVQVSSNKQLLGEQYDWCDIVIIHLVALHEAVTIARRFGKPIVHICHNDHIKPREGYLVYNSAWLAAHMNINLPSIVVHPPTKAVLEPESHFHAKNIALINTNPNKGGSTLLGIAKQMPQHKFLGIHGGYSKAQLTQPVPNIMYRPYNPAGVDYSDIRIVIVPSQAESWSLVAAEAMARGIPVICSDLPGLRENCGDAGIYASCVKEYVDAIRLLDYENVYEKQRREVLARFMLHNYNDELNNLYNFIENIVAKEAVTHKT